MKAVESPFLVKSIHGTNRVTRKCTINIFDTNSEFFLLPTLETFDGIIGYDLLREINANLDLNKLILKYKTGSENLQHLHCKDVNNIVLTPLIEELKIKHAAVFSNPEESLPYNTNIVATIRTTDNEAVYSKSYPYPMAASEFVNSEIHNLLRDGIIRPSRSPYNSPIWVVPKRD